MPSMRHCECREGRRLVASLFSRRRLEFVLDGRIITAVILVMTEDLTACFSPGCPLSNPSRSLATTPRRKVPGYLPSLVPSYQMQD